MTVQADDPLPVWMALATTHLHYMTVQAVDPPPVWMALATTLPSPAFALDTIPKNS
jgi:hypothetical protein